MSARHKALAALDPPGTSAPNYPRFERAFFVFGLRRGGNHAVAEWLKGHFAPDEVLHLNDAEVALFENDGAALRIDGRHHARVIPAERSRACVIGYENADFLAFPFARNRWVARRCDVLVVLRDLPNTAASIARSARERPDFAWRHRMRDFPALWQTYARRFAENRGEGVTYISFNRWFADPACREELAARLMLLFTDRGLNVVSPFGGGSSFDGLSCDGRAQEMDVLQRWPALLDDDLFLLLLLAAPENLARNAALFGNFPLSHDKLLARWRKRALPRDSIAP